MDETCKHAEFWWEKILGREHSEDDDMKLHIEINCFELDSEVMKWIGLAQYRIQQ
jgi:hypothetical protein